MFKIEDNTNTEFRYPEIIQHLATFKICNAINCFGVHDHGIKGD